MTSPYDLFGTDKDLEAGAGVTLDYPGFSITIHRAGGSNRKFARIMAAKLRPHRRKHEQGLIDEELANEILAEAYAESVIIGWKDVKGKDGKKLEFTVDNCKNLLIDLPDLFKDIQDQASSINTFKNEQEETEEKN